MQVILITSNGKEKIVQGFFHQWYKYTSFNTCPVVICGFDTVDDYCIGNFSDYPANRWSNALIKILDNIADEVFLLMLDDYWLIRQIDQLGLEMMYDYMRQFQNVIKFDVASERLYAEGGGKYLYGYHTYNTLGHLDLIKSNHQSPYHLSLWGGLWRRDLLREITVPNESAQQMELNGTHRLAQYGDEMLVLGTRQAPLLHANVIQRGEWNTDETTGLPALKESDLQELKELGCI